MDNILKGKVWKYENDVDTDVIIPARYLNTSEPSELADESSCLFSDWSLLETRIYANVLLIIKSSLFYVIPCGNF